MVVVCVREGAGEDERLSLRGKGEMAMPGEVRSSAKEIVSLYQTSSDLVRKSSRSAISGEISFDGLYRARSHGKSLTLSCNS